MESGKRDPPRLIGDINLTWQQIADAAGYSTAFVTAAILGRHPLPERAAVAAATLLGLDDEAITQLQTTPSRGSIPGGIPTDPTIYRFYEMLQVYGTTLEALVHEQFGDSIISAINSSSTCGRCPTPTAANAQ
ncbi:cyanase [Nocardia sp. CA-120079]|uniref:cyanase n=1 Tax=Nocardia sp. CA-120079 TaxID=3239974 RepID=UPI003D9588CD